ncbi:MAG: MATE family efflux transporter [Bacteroidales bacterium]|nr:MATE family efflux transporter [Bacteroidales bacterium]
MLCKNDNRDSIDFGESNIKKLFGQLFFPTLFGMLFSMAFVLTDGIFVGHGIGPHGLASVNLIGPIMMIINGLGMMFGIGASVVSAIHLSHNNIKAARINITQAYGIGMVISFIMGIVCFCFPKTVLSLLGASGDLYEATYEYYIWFIPTCLLMMIETIGLFVIRLDGSPRYAMMSNIIAAIVNIVLDYLFIFPCKMGLMGASLATDIGGLVAVIMIVHYMFFHAKTLKPYKLKASRKSLFLSLRNIIYMTRIGASGFVGELAVAFMMLVGNLSFKKYLNADGVSAYSVACYLFPIVYMIYSAVTQSAQPIISYNYGAKKRERVRKATGFSIFISISLGLVATLVFLLFAPWITSIFIEEGQAAGELAKAGLPYYSLSFPFMAVNLCIIGYYQSIERAGLAVLLTSLRGIILLTATFLTLPIWLGVKGLWLSIPAAEFATTAFILILQLSLKYRIKQPGLSS